MTRKTKDNRGPRTISAADISTLNLPFSLYHLFAGIEDVPIRFCGLDGRLLSGISPTPLSGPCAVLSKNGALSDTCATSHADAIAVAAELRRPYIFNCHMRLAGWAIPLFQQDKSIPAAIILGGILFLEPDAALTGFAERSAPLHGADAAVLANSLDSVPVLSREHARAIADFLFRMSAAFMAHRSPAETQRIVSTSSQTSLPPASLVFPPARRKETRKTKERRAEECRRLEAEMEIVRLLRERKPGEAFRSLEEWVQLELESDVSNRGFASNLILAELFARLLRILTGGGEVPESLRHKQATLIGDVLRKGYGDSPAAIERSCRDFIDAAEQVVGAPRSRKVKMIQKFVELNLSRKLTLATVSRKFGLSEKGLNALVRKQYGMSFSEYVTSLRVTEARRLLHSTDLTLGQIARETGFNDQSYFTKVFKSHIGMTPTEFRAKEA